MLWHKNLFLWDSLKKFYNYRNAMIQFPPTPNKILSKGEKDNPDVMDCLEEFFPFV